MGRLEPFLSVDLAELRRQASSQGWAVCRGSFRHLWVQAQLLHWKEVPVRKGEGAVKELRPVSQSQAQPRSLSAVYGTGAQPLHSDGAHLRTPPDVVVMSCELPSTTPTLIWSNSSNRNSGRVPNALMPESVREGLFVVNSGSDAFLAAAHKSDTGWRFDPGCMTPADQRAREAEEYIAGLRESAFVHEWSEKDTILLVDNRISLHARAAVREGDEGRVIRRVAFNSKGKS
jgi:hypothetical protein